MLTELESKQVLAAYGIPTVETQLARSEAEAVSLAHKIGFPVVLKVYSETITHKTDVGGVKEMVTHEETGLVVPMNDPEALAAGLVRLLREPATGRRLGAAAQRLGAAAQRRYQLGYRPEIMSRALEDLFVDLLERRRGRAT